jgi:hypothetical protein
MLGYKIIIKGCVIRIPLACIIYQILIELHKSKLLTFVFCQYFSTVTVSGSLFFVVLNYLLFLNCLYAKKAIQIAIMLIKIFPIFEMLNIPKATIAKLPNTQIRSSIEIVETSILFVNCFLETYQTKTENTNKFSPMIGKIY